MKDWFLATAVSAIAIFRPIEDLLLVTLVLIAVDLVTGLLAAKKRGEWKKFTEIKSSGLRRTFSKFWIYMTGIMIGFLIQHYMIKELIPIANIAAGLISVIEGKSIYENLDTINGAPLFKALIQKLGSVNDLPKDEDKNEE